MSLLVSKFVVRVVGMVEGCYLLIDLILSVRIHDPPLPEHLQTTERRNDSQFTVRNPYVSVFPFDVRRFGVAGRIPRLTGVDYASRMVVLDRVQDQAIVQKIRAVALELND